VGVGAGPRLWDLQKAAGWPLFRFWTIHYTAELLTWR
jgi:hypothetical protein